MQDFVRIGGEIVSAPLNENFRRLLNAISIANTNLVFPEKDAIVDTIKDMLAIKDPVNAQTCYVISSGELYRYSKKTDEWIKIADFGQTFRQGFLNSGAVVLEDDIKLKENSSDTLILPSMLVYFKNQPGDDRYLKGMYLIEQKEVNVSGLISGANAYSLMINYLGETKLMVGLPSEDDPNLIYLGTFLVDRENRIMPDFVYTLPDMPYTADRGEFLMNKGRSTGCNLMPTDTNDAHVNRKDGYYYDEGINFIKGKTDNYPIDSDNGSNYNLKYFNEETPVDKIYYMVPKNPLNNDIVTADGLIINKYWDGEQLRDVPEGHFTIQQHLMTPNGQDIILYGTVLYNSITDAISNINSVYGIDISFPYVETTRIVVGNHEQFTTGNEQFCRFYTLGRLTQVGTISPEFADNIFKIYSGDANDTTPSTVRFDLSQLQKEEYNNLFTLQVLPSKTKREIFSLEKSYITDDNEISNIMEEDDIRQTSDGKNGYDIADTKDLDYIRQRLDKIEMEIWNPYVDSKQRYEQSIRYRIFQNEELLKEHTDTLNNHSTRITTLENTKVNKNTTINGHHLGDTDNKLEQKAITLVTGDINEGQGNGDTINLWYTDERVSSNQDVAASKTHINTISKNDNANSHIKTNPHNISTDDINILADTTKIFVTPEEERRIRSDRLPENTIEELKKIKNETLEGVYVDYFEGNSSTPGQGPIELGTIKNMRFFKDGVNISLDSDGETLVIECVGQMDEDTIMFKSRYATLEQEYPNLYGGYVDNAVNAVYAHNIHNIETATENQYYGTNSDSTVGIYDLPVYVGTTDTGDFANIDQVVFVPVDGSVEEKHLEESLRNKINNNYHSVLNNGQVKSSEINSFSFGNNLSVEVQDHTAIINANGGGTGSVSNFVNLSDVNVVYTNNKGKTLVVNEEENGIELSDMPSLQDYMLKAVYVDTNDVSKVKKAVRADNANLADSATNALAVNNKTVNDNQSTDAVLWTAAKIKANTTEQIAAEGVRIYHGTNVPSDSLGKDGDLYILIDEEV